MVLCSFFISTRRVFKEVIVGILIVGYIHKDIDGYFRYLSRRLWRNDTYITADLMKSLMDSQSKLAFILDFVQEVEDFKKFKIGYHYEGTNALIRLEEMHLLKFTFKIINDQ